MLPTLQFDPTGSAAESLRHEPSQSLIGGFVHGRRSDPDDEMVAARIAHFVPGGAWDEFDPEAAALRCREQPLGQSPCACIACRRLGNFCLL